MNKVKMTDDFLEILKKYNYKPYNIKKEENTTLTQKESEALLEQFGLEKKYASNKDDVLEFIQCFGAFYEDVYSAFKPLKDKANVSWKEIKNIRFSDIDFANNTIEFPNQEIKNKGQQR